MSLPASLSSESLPYDTSYKYGFTTDVETDVLPKGLNEEIIRAISLKKNEPAFMLEFRLKAYQKWLEMEEPHWVNVNYPISATTQPRKKNQNWAA